MTLPELLGRADDHVNEIVELKDLERDYLFELLESYAEDILDPGQIKKIDSVTLIKALNGETRVLLDGLSQLE